MNVLHIIPYEYVLVPPFANSMLSTPAAVDLVTALSIIWGPYGLRRCVTVTAAVA